MPAIFGGAIVTEQIFRVPGIGSLLISAILANDTPVIMAVTFVFACLWSSSTCIADLLYGWLTPPSPTAEALAACRPGAGAQAPAAPRPGRERCGAASAATSWL